jgi:hypothetical protein
MWVGSHSKSYVIAVVLLMSAKKFVPNKIGDVRMWVGSHPKSYVIASTFVVVLLISNIGLRM